MLSIDPSSKNNKRNNLTKRALSVTVIYRQTINKKEVGRGRLPFRIAPLPHNSNVTADAYSGEQHERNRTERPIDSRGIDRQNPRRNTIHLGSFDRRTLQGFPQAMKLPRQCLDCGAITDAGKSRCAIHQRAKRKVWDRGSVLNRKRRMQNGDGAAARLRAQVNREGGGLCISCNDYYPAPMLNVDHIVRMANGGADEDGNLQLLCKYHHNIKNRRESSPS